MTGNGEESLDREKRREETFDPKSIIEKMRSEYWEAVEKAPESEPEEISTLLIFRVGRERFAFPVKEVREITRVPPLIARVPRGTESLFGVMNLRGQIIPVLDLRAMLGVKRGEIGPKCRVVVLRGEEGDLGILAEDVPGLIDLPISAWLSPLTVETALPASFVMAQAKDREGILAILDRQTFFTLDSLGMGIR